RRALSGLTPPAAWTAVLELASPNTTGTTSASPTQPGIRFAAPAARPADSIAGARITELLDDQTLVTYRSQPLLSLVKSLNDYSTNIIKPFADAAGGALAVEALARSTVPPQMRSEITL